MHALNLDSRGRVEGEHDGAVVAALEVVADLDVRHRRLERGVH